MAADCKRQAVWRGKTVFKYEWPQWLSDPVARKRAGCIERMMDMSRKAEIVVSTKEGQFSRAQVFEELIYKVIGVKCKLAEAPDVDDKELQSIKERAQVYLDEKHRQEGDGE